MSNPEAAQVIAAYVANNQVSTSELPELISKVKVALENETTPIVAAEPRSFAAEMPEVERQPENQGPAVPIGESIHPDYIVCLEDGEKLKVLKRHLKAKFGMNPDDYRRKWGLPNDYPMTAANYTKARSTMAKQLGLGQRKLKKNSGGVVQR